jgi:Tol biopolymer transport system component
MLMRMGGAAIAAAVILAAPLSARGDTAPTARAPDEATKRLAEEVRDKGWIVFSARSEAGDWDLFLMRPDGSSLKNLTRTPEYHEAAPHLSRDGRRLLCRRLPRDETIDNNHFGTQGELVFADSDGTDAKAFGASGEYPWASWSPDGTQIACLSIKGISFVDIASHKVVRTLERKGFFQQLTWSPDGRWLSGVANSFGTEWAIARMDAATGEANAVSREQCCTPDWFPDSRSLIFSNRPTGQKARGGYGWTQLWTADAEGKSRHLVYGEDGRHVYGGHVSPDGKYVLFTGNMAEDGDPGHAGAPMGLMRLADAPIIGGKSEALRALHPGTKDGPVLVLPAGWEPCWTFADIPAGNLASAAAPDKADGSAALARELHGKGWLVFSAESGQGDYDLVMMRPDGSGRAKLTDTRAWNEAGARFSPDGKRLLYYRMPKGEAVDNNTYGTYDLVVARADGSGATVLGKDFPWASWGADSMHLAYLGKSGIQVIDLTGRAVGQPVARKGIVQQLVWSPDGRWFVGTANGLGPYWNIGRLGAETGQMNAVSETERYNCTPDWMPDSQRVLYSRGIIPEKGGWAQLWVASGDGREKRPVCAEEGRHLYGGCASPDGKYVVFTRSEADLGKVDNSKTRMAVIRWADTPILIGESAPLRATYPQARSGPVLDLAWGWEPHWTYSDINLPGATP